MLNTTMTQPFNMSTMTLPLALNEYNKSIELRRAMLKADKVTDWFAWKEVLENEIETLGATKEPSNYTIAKVKDLINHWMIIDWLIKDKESEDLRLKAQMASIMADFRGMKQGKQSLHSPFRGDTLFGHTLTKPSQVKGLERVISACKCYENCEKSIIINCGIIH